MHISDSNFTTFKCDSVLPQIGPKISASFSLTQGFCDPKVTQVTINQALKRTMFWVETTCWYLIDTTLLFNKNIPPPTFFPNSTHLHHVGSFFPPHQAENLPPQKKTNTKKLIPPTLLMELAAAVGVYPFIPQASITETVPPKWPMCPPRADGFKRDFHINPRWGTTTMWADLFFSGGFFGKLQLDV